jgi:DNA invertase Pin-like site-specific DNA recombinase
MRAAIYARKSTDDDRSEENRSVTRQIERARQFAEGRGWSVAEDLIFVDDGISGAEFNNRPGLNRLLNQLKNFDVLVMAEASRLGRDMLRNAALINDILERGVRLFYYLTGEEETASTPEQRMMMTLRGYAAEVEREKASQRARDALERKARKDYNTGGTVYGYTNVPVYTQNGSGEEVSRIPSTGSTPSRRR